MEIEILKKCKLNYRTVVHVLKLHVWEDTSSIVLLNRFGNFATIVVLLSPNVLMDPGNTLFKNQIFET